MDSDTIGLVVLVGVAVTIFQIILFFKVWGMCNDVRAIRNRVNEPFDDIRFWERARYESEKRRGIITQDDIEKAEAFIEETGVIEW